MPWASAAAADAMASRVALCAVNSVTARIHVGRGRECRWHGHGRGGVTMVVVNVVILATRWGNAAVGGGGTWT